jgi:putative ABC transport system substrate-binding protein
MQRREFIAFLGGVTAAWPLAARAQQGERTRQVGMLLSGTADDAVFQTWVGAFLRGLAQSGWIIGRNVRIETRWAGSKADDIRRHAQELAVLAPDVILAHGGSTVRPLLQSTHSIPIVFTIVTDPVGNGYVESLARPGRNATGFMINDYSLNAKYPELLKEIVPGITQVAVLRDASQGAGTGDFAVIQVMAPLLRMQANAIDLREAGEIESAVAAFARSPNGGLIMPGSAAGRHYRDLIISLAARHKLPAVYSERHFAAAGGLITYGANWVDQYRLAAGYVDRILKGEKPADLPVQAPNKYELAINLKTAKALGLSVPQSLLARADEVIE